MATPLEDAATQLEKKKGGLCVEDLEDVATPLEGAVTQLEKKKDGLCVEDATVWLENSFD